MLKIYGNLMSQPCNKIRFVANILKVDYEWIDLDFAKGEHKTPEHLARHPAGKLPAIDDDGFILFESEAICRYLNAKHHGALIPANLKAAAITEQWNAFAVQHLGLAMSKVLFNRVLAPKFGIPVDANSLSEGLSWLDRYLPIAETRLSQSVNFGADEVTLADISLLAILAPAAHADIDLNPYAKLTAWQSRLASQDWYNKGKASA
ncbi:MAG: glutathione S-transferase family protein [Verrucomicrobia bacterium]|nr:glutathione S-transferase family protein [Verrucomicrobiota bacterium]